MIKQAEGLKHNPHLMLIDDADRPAKWYFALKANLLNSRSTGEPMEHPMSGPVNTSLAQFDNSDGFERSSESPARLLFRKNERPRCRWVSSRPREHNKVVQHIALTPDALRAIDQARP